MFMYMNLLYYKNKDLPYFNQFYIFKHISFNYVVILNVLIIFFIKLIVIIILLNIKVKDNFSRFVDIL